MGGVGLTTLTFEKEDATETVTENSFINVRTDRLTCHFFTENCMTASSEIQKEVADMKKETTNTTNAEVRKELLEGTMYKTS